MYKKFGPLGSMGGPKNDNVIIFSFLYISVHVNSIFQIHVSFQHHKWGSHTNIEDLMWRYRLKKIWTDSLCQLFFKKIIWGVCQNKLKSNLLKGNDAVTPSLIVIFFRKWEENILCKIFCKVWSALPNTLL